AHARLAAEREVGDRQAGGEAGRAGRKLPHATFGGERDRAALDPCDVLRAAAIGLVVVLTVAAAEGVEQAHGRPQSSSLASASRAAALVCPCSPRSFAIPSTHASSPSGSRLMTTPRTS